MPELLEKKLQQKATCQVQTLIFVDVDGVLNVRWMHQEVSGRWILEMNSSMKRWHLEGRLQDAGDCL